MLLRFLVELGHGLGVPEAVRLAGVLSATFSLQKQVHQLVEHSIAWRGQRNRVGLAFLHAFPTDCWVSTSPEGSLAPAGCASGGTSSFFSLVSTISAGLLIVARTGQRCDAECSRRSPHMHPQHTNQQTMQNNDRRISKSRMRYTVIKPRITQRRPLFAANRVNKRRRTDPPPHRSEEAELRAEKRSPQQPKHVRSNPPRKFAERAVCSRQIQQPISEIWTCGCAINFIAAQ